jgi:hypothetical protein
MLTCNAYLMISHDTGWWFASCALREKSFMRGLVGNALMLLDASA